MNEAINFIRKTYEFNKNGFENVYNAMSSLQEQAQETTLRLVNENPLFPEPAKKMVKSGFETCIKSRDAFKDQVDKNQKAFEEMLNPTKEK